MVTVTGLADFNYKPTDWYYAVPDWEESSIGFLGGNIPKIAVGRLPVKNEEELEQTLSKIIEVESQLEPGSLLFLGDSNVELYRLLSNPYCHYASYVNTTSGNLNKLLSKGVVYAISFTHGDPLALWTRSTNGEWRTLLTYKEVVSIQGTYAIHYIVACFTGAIDIGNESLARALAVSPTGPALVIASSRTEGTDNTISSRFWECFFDTGNVGGSFIQALRSYLLDENFFTSQKPAFQRYNFYLTKVIYGDVSWEIKEPRKKIIESQHMIECLQRTSFPTVSEIYINNDAYNNTIGLSGVIFLVLITCILMMKTRSKGSFRKLLCSRCQRCAEH
ncbi:MAG: C25 family cysteine peptidase [Thermoproteota archaeon]